MVFSCKKYSLILMSLLPFVFLTSGCGHKDDIFGPGRIDTNNRGKLGKVEAKSNDEIAERLRIMDQTSDAIKASDFATLNKMVSEYRVKRSLTPSGTWKLSRFYQRLNYHFANDEKLTACKNPAAHDFINRWTAFSPEEPAVHIMAASAARAEAWCIRGNNFAHEVRKERMEAFGSRMLDTFENLQKVKPIASKDPQFFVEMAEIYPNVGADRSQLMDLINEAINAEPYYYDTYLFARAYFKEKWLGETGDLERFDEYVTAATAGGTGRGVYARMQWFRLHERTSPNDPSFYDAVEWKKWKAGMRDVARLYPDDWNHSKFASFACLAQDYPEALHYFKKMKTIILGAGPDEAAMMSCQKAAGFEGKVKIDRTNW